jgi:hypothetical protein
MNKRYTLMVLACVGLVAGILACNAPTPTPHPLTPTVTPYIPSTLPAQETLPPTPTQWFPSTHTPMPVQPMGTDTPLAQTTTPTTTATLTPTPPVSTGPLDFARPERLEYWEAQPDGKYECKIVLRITGGAPPYTIHHDLEIFTTGETRPALVFTAHGCGAIVHTIMVESADGQSVTHDYWIPAPWCEE